MGNALRVITAVKPPIQLLMVLESRELMRMSEAEHRTALVRLAHLILEAGGIDIKEIGNDNG